ncbi:Hsp20/alpha crystallin family protein [Microcoleus sp. FACHB-672]|uniref:Hsp20/alpha crystallin family protein n=1 Tax=Microcoleus sp. FACHB-672 TaxID=2692825 RepID=UPI0016825AD7|nr:Hsp20/alpha crystallin family protein [Microcoleus sp. FACHB-672]MBD2041320.1 Hsp20/alpha crystallin family protein [Microcoleus sp. FACHB-672]
MTRMYMQPWHELATMQNQLERMFGLPQTRNCAAVNSSQSGISWAPAIELQNTETALILRAEVPGVEAKDLDVRVSRQAVEISGQYQQKQTDNQGRYRTEFRYGNFQRVIQLPMPVLNEQLQAELKDGILTLTLPKESSVRPKVVKVNIVDATDATPAPADSGNEVETTIPSDTPATPENNKVVVPADAEVTGDVWNAA